MLRRRWTLALVALLGGAVAVMPAVAGSETVPGIEAVNTTGIYKEQRHYWYPAQVTVAPGGSVTVSNHSSEVAHGVHWVAGPATPSCAGTVPVGTEATAAGTNWSGSCTFAAAGVYTFYCTVHGAEMTGQVTVQAPGETAPTTTTTPPPPPASGGGQGAGPPVAGSPQPAMGGSPLAGAGLRLSAALRSRSVRGSLRVGAGGAGGRLEVDLLAPKGSLARAGAPRLARVGRLVRSRVPAGVVSFRVALDARALRALGVRHRLALTVRVLLTPPHGATATLSRGLLLRR